MGRRDQLAALLLRALSPAIRDLDTRLRVVERAVPDDLGVRLRAYEKILNRLETSMSRMQDTLDNLNAATNALGEKVSADRALIQSVRQQLADALAANPAAQADLDAAIAGMDATTATLRGLAADQDAPVPPSDPIVGDSGDTTAGEPGVDPPAESTGQVF